MHAKYQKTVIQAVSLDINHVMATSKPAKFKLNSFFKCLVILKFHNRGMHISLQLNNY